MPKIILLNPTLERNSSITIALVEQILGKNPGIISEYTTYTLTDSEGIKRQYILSHPLMHLIASPLDGEPSGPKRINVFEPTAENAGSFGTIYPVICSIIFEQERPFFESNNSFVIKKLNANPNAPLDKPHKPPAEIRVARREQYLASQFLGACYPGVEYEQQVFIHMDRVAGMPLHYYWDKLNAEQFLALSWALLEQIPAQLQHKISYGKHKDKQVVHCDIKYNNIMAHYADNRWLVRLVDFGLAKAIPEGQSYRSKKARGNTHCYDSELVASIHHHSLFYSAQTDIYALFNVIVELAGARFRTKLKAPTSAFIADLKKPNLVGLFSNMDFDLPLQSQLTSLIQSMLCDNRAQRASISQTLAGFQSAYAVLLQQRAAAPPQASLVGAKTVPSLVEFIEFIQRPLEPINPDIPYPQVAAKNLLAWIQQFRSSYKQLTEAERRQFQQQLPSLKFKSRYVSDFFRFSPVLEEYNEQAASRLLIKHSKIVRQLKTSRLSCPDWDKRYNQLLDTLPLQVSADDELFCHQLSVYKESALMLLTWPDENDESPLFYHLRETINIQLKMPFEQWFSHLPEYAELFNRQYACLVRMMLFLEELGDTLDFADPEFFTIQNQQSIGSWAEALCYQVIKNQSLDEVHEQLELRTILLNCLTNYIAAVKQIDHEPEMRQLAPVDSIYSIKAINQLIGQLDFAQPKQIKTLLQRFELLPYLERLNSLLNSKDGLGKQYHPIKNKVSGQLKLLVGSTAPVDAAEQIKKLLHYVEALVQLDNYLGIFNDGIRNFTAIQQAVRIVMHEPEVSILLCDTTTRYSYPDLHISPYLRSFNTGLARLLAEPSADLAQKILAEFSHFYHCPHQYSAFRAPSNGDGLSLFSPRTPKADSSTTIPKPAALEFN